MNEPDAGAPGAGPIRTATPDDFAAVARMSGLAFAYSFADGEIAGVQAALDLDRFLIATDAAQVVGSAGEYRFAVTVPGGASVVVPGVTFVAVAVTHRRRGILTRLMECQLGRYRADGEAFAVLTASEGAIYGRFGYGPATQVRDVRIDRRQARLAAPVDVGAVRVAGVDEARISLPALHRRWCAQTPGAIGRSDGWWERFFPDQEWQREGMSERHFLIHPDGYVAFRIATVDGAPIIRIRDDAVVGPAARAALWQVLLSFDLYAAIETQRLAVDDPLPFLLRDPRQVQTGAVDDGLWIRLIDVERSLAERTYGIEIDAVVEVVDPMFGDARYRVRGGPDGATCTRSDDSADVRCGIGALGSAYLGGHRINQLAAAGLIEVDDPALRQRLDLAFLSERAPVHGTSF